MKLRLPVVLAHVRKDFLALRVMFLLWAAYMAVDVVGIGFYIGGGASVVSAVKEAVPGFTLLFGIQFVLPFVLIVGAIQDDPLMEPDAFWRTRPISRLELLAAKALVVAVLSLVSFAAWSGLTAVQPNIRVAATPLLFTGSLWAFLLGLAAFASVTPTFLRLVVAGIAASLVVTVVAIPMKLAMLGTRTGHGLVYYGHGRLATFFIAIGFAAIFVHQYLTLRTKVSLGLLLLLLLAGVFFG